MNSTHDFPGSATSVARVAADMSMDDGGPFAHQAETHHFHVRANSTFVPSVSFSYHELGFKSRLV